MANVKITELTALTDPASTDVLPIVDVVADVTKKISIADLLENAGSGTAAAPGIAFDGDSNTGIYRPGADQLALATNGTAALTVDASQRVGVGTQSPSYTLDVATTGNSRLGANTIVNAGNSNEFVAVNASGENKLFIKNYATAGNSGGIKWHQRNTASTSFRYDKLFVDPDNGLQYYSKNGGDFDGTEDALFTITRGGSVGIRTQSPSSILHLHASNPVLTMQDSDTADDSILSYILFKNSSGIDKGYIGRAGSSDLRIFNNGDTVFATGGIATSNEVMRIASDGKLGVGTSSPSQLLHVYQTETNSQAYQLIENNRSRNAATQYKTTLGSWYVGNGIGADANRFTVYQGGTGDRLVINSSGNVGIGTTSVSAKLHIAGATGGGIAGIWDTTAGGARIEYKDNGTRRGYLNWDTNSLILAADSGNSLKFSTNAGVTQHATIDSSGRLLVGTSSSLPAHSQLQVEGTGYYEGGASLRRNSNDTGGTALRICKSRGTSNGSFTPVVSGDTLGIVQFNGADGNSDEIGAEIRGVVDGSVGNGNMPGSLVFSTNSGAQNASPTERMRIDSQGVISQTGEYRLYTALYSGSVTDNGATGTATFDVTFNFPDNNNFMIVEIFGYHSLYNGEQEYYRFMASHRTNSNLYNHNILDDLTSTGSIAQTNTSVTFTGRRPRSTIGTSINSIIRVVYRGQLTPNSVTIANS